MKKIITVIAIIMAIALICFLAAGYAALRLVKKPQSTPLSLVTPTKGQPVSPTQAQPEPSATPSPKPALVLTQTPPPLQPTSTSTIQATPVCGQTGKMTLLVLGRSIHLPAKNYRSDLVRLVKLDFDQSKILIYAIPAELVVQTPNLTQKYKTTYARLGDIPTVIINADGISAESEYTAIQAVAQAILDNFEIAADHYFLVEEDVVIEVIDTLKGIEVNLPVKFAMPAYSKYKGMVLEPGKYLFDGEMVHAYMTYRENPAGEWQRFSHQNVILDGMRVKLMDPAVFLKIPDLYRLYQQNIVTDLSIEQILSAGCLARQVSSQSITFDSIPPEELKIEADGSMRLLQQSVAVSRLQSLFIKP